MYVLGVLHGMDRERRVQDYLISLYHYDDLSTEELWLGEYDLVLCLERFTGLVGTSSVLP